MGEITKFRIAAILVAAAVAAPAFAADNHEWNNLNRLKPGQRIGVVQKDGKKLEGTFSGVTDADIAITAGPVVRVTRDNVVRVYRRPRLTRAWHVAIGAGAGVVLGAVLNGTVGQYFRNEGHDTSPAVWIGAGAALGAGLGAASGGGDQTVYQRP
jgi:hypothetical protein